MKSNIAKWAGLLGIIISIAAVITLYAASVHLKGQVTLTDNGTTATVCGALAGLGNGDVTLTLTGTGTTSVTCTNPAGNFAPGNAGDVSVGATQTIPATEIKNGNVSFCITTTAPACSSARDCGCPNDNWTATVTDVAFSSMTLVVEQGGQVVLTTQVK